MKVLAFIGLHYGSDFIGFAVKSVYDQVDHVVVLYSPQPSHGHTTDARNPDTVEKLKEALFAFGDPEGKIQWHEGVWGREGEHRDAIYPIAKDLGVDMILTVDADEVWHGPSLEQSLRYAYGNQARISRLHFEHFWRSFKWVCRDGMTPERIVKMSNHSEPFGYVPQFEHPVWHFGYARKPEDVQYKIGIHGHSAEWKPNWFQAKFMPWPAPKDVHPTCNDIWTPEPFDPSVFPEFMHSHPYWDMEPIQ